MPADDCCRPRTRISSGSRQSLGSVASARGAIGPGTSVAAFCMTSPSRNQRPHSVSSTNTRYSIREPPPDMFGPVPAIA